jgi:hypothetical protein
VRRAYSYAFLGLWLVGTVFCIWAGIGIAPLAFQDVDSNTYKGGAILAFFIRALFAMMVLGLGTCIHIFFAGLNYYRTHGKVSMLELDDKPPH